MLLVSAHRRQGQAGIGEDEASLVYIMIFQGSQSYIRRPTPNVY